MRDKFSELIDRGVAKFDYTNIVKAVPDTDPVCRNYNNIFSIPSDTHMSMLKDGRRVITGHIIGTSKWNSFACACTWGGIDFRRKSNAGWCCVLEFLYSMGLEGHIDVLNGDTVFMVVPRTETNMCHNATCPDCACTTESGHKLPVSMLSVRGNEDDVKKCWEGAETLDDIVRSLNESSNVYGDRWFVTEDQIMGELGNRVVQFEGLESLAEKERIKKINEAKELDAKTLYKDWLYPALEDMMFELNMKHIDDPDEKTFREAIDIFIDKFYKD